MNLAMPGTAKCNNSARWISSLHGFWTHEWNEVGKKNKGLRIVSHPSAHFSQFALPHQLCCWFSFSSFCRLLAAKRVAYFYVYLPKLDGSSLTSGFVCSVQFFVCVFVVVLFCVVWFLFVCFFSQGCFFCFCLVFCFTQYIYKLTLILHRHGVWQFTLLYLGKGQVWEAIVSIDHLDFFSAKDRCVQLTVVT